MKYCLLGALFLLLHLGMSAQVYNRAYQLPATFNRIEKIDQSQGNGWAVGVKSYGDPVLGSQLFLMNIATDGSLRWQVKMNAPERHTFSIVKQISGGRVFAATYLETCVTSFPNSGDLVLYDSTGRELWRILNQSLPLPLFISTAIELPNQQLALNVNAANILLIDLNSGSFQIRDLKYASLGIDFLAHYPGNDDRYIVASWDELQVYEQDSLLSRIIDLAYGSHFVGLESSPDKRHLLIKTYYAGMYFLHDNGQLDTLPFKTDDTYFLFNEYFGVINAIDTKIITMYRYSQPSVPLFTYNVFDFTILTPRGFLQTPTDTVVLGEESTGLYRFGGLRWTRLEHQKITDKNTSDIHIKQVTIDEGNWAQKMDEYISKSNISGCKIKVENVGANVIQNVNLNVALRPIYSTWPYACDPPKTLSRRFDHLNLAPRQTTVIDFGSIPDIEFPKEFGICVWSTFVNDGVDRVHWNDQFCGEDIGPLYPNPDQFRVFPNPAHDKLWISVPIKEAASVRMQMYNLTGYKILDDYINKTLDYYELDISNLQSGVYILQTGPELVKFIKI